MNDREGFRRIDTEQPFDLLDRLLTKALRVLPWVLVGMALTALLIQVGMKFSNH